MPLGLELRELPSRIVDSILHTGIRMPSPTENNLPGAALKLVALLVVVPELGYGYIDPGSGSFLLQAALAGLLGLSFTIKSFWRNIRGRFTRNAGPDSKNS